MPPPNAGLYLHMRTKVDDLLARRAAVTDAVMAGSAPTLASSMKGSHPWRNRTQRAENGLFASYKPSKKFGNLRIFELSAGYHDVPYAVHLELGMGQRFAILGPSMRTLFSRLTTEVHHAREAVK